MPKISPLNSNTGLVDGDETVGFSISRPFQSYLNQIEALKVKVGSDQIGIHIDDDGIVRIGDGVTNYTQFDVDGTITLVGTARVKQEFALGAESFSPGASGADSVVLNNYSGWSFDIGDDMVMSFEIPYDCDVSEPLKVEVYWYINEAYGAGAQVKWQIVYACCPADATEAIDAPTHSDTVTFVDKNIPATAKYLIDNSALIPAASIAQDDLVSINLERIAADGTDPTADPVVLRVEIEYTVNKLGEP
jgi:hypothetical protein